MRRAILLLSSMALFCGHSYAQHVDLYVTLNVTHLGDVYTGQAASGTGFRSQYESLTKAATGYGATLQLVHAPLVTLGLDVRGARRSGVNGFDSTLFSARASASKPLLHIKPYLQAGAGFLAAHATNTSSASSGLTTSDNITTTHYAMYEVLGGLDYPVLPYLNIRLVEVGGGSSFGYSPNTSLFELNSGVVLHF